LSAGGDGSRRSQPCGFSDYTPAGIVIGIAAAIASSSRRRPLANRLFVIQINATAYLCEFACAERPASMRRPSLRSTSSPPYALRKPTRPSSWPAAAGAKPAVMVRALGPIRMLATRAAAGAADARLNRAGSGAASKATKLRAVFARIAAEPSITWIDSQSRRTLNFWTSTCCRSRHRCW
jgi:hypothetical protein